MHRIPLQRRRTAILAAATAILSTSPTLAATAANWLNAVSGNWIDGTKWSTNPSYPNNGSPIGTTYDTKLAATGSAYTVTLAHVIEIDRLTLDSVDATLSVSPGGSLRVLGEFDIRAGAMNVFGTLSAATIVSSTGAEWVMPTYGAHLYSLKLDTNTEFSNDLNLASGLTLLNGRSLEFTGGAEVTTLNAMTIGGLGEIVFRGGGGFNYNQILNNGQLTIAPGITIRNDAANGYLGDFNSTNAARMLTNQGTIRVEAAGREFGMVGYWNNQGTIQVSAGKLLLGGNVTTAGLGTIVRTGGEIEVTGTIDNTGASLALHDSTGPWKLVNGTIKGGTVSLSGAGTFARTKGTLDGVTLQSAQPLVINDALTFKNVTYSGDISIASPDASTPGRLIFSAAETISGNIDITFDGATETSEIWNLSGGTVTLGPGVTVRTGTRGGVFGLSGASWVNQGLIWADTPNKSIGLYGNWTNAGILRVGGTASLNLGGALTQAAIGTLERTGGGGTVNLVGSLTGGLALTASTGTWTLATGGSIVGGTVSTGSGAELRMTGGTLSGVTLAGTARRIDGSGSVEFDNGLTLDNGTIVLDSAASFVGIRSSATQTLGGTGELVSNGLFDLNFVLPAGGTTLTVGPNVTLRSGTGGLRVGDFNSLNNFGRVVNEGTIVAQTPGRAVELSGLWTNLGTLRVTAGSLNLGGQFSRADLGTIDAQGGQINVTGNLDNSGGTLLLGNGTGSWNLAGGTITGGTIATADGKSFTAVNGTLSGVTVDTDWTVGGKGLVVHVQDNVTLGGQVITVGTSAGAGKLNLRGTQTLGGDVEIAFAPAPFAGSVTSESAPLTITADSVLRTAGGNADIGSSVSPPQANTNLGLVSARTAGNFLHVHQFTNHGTMEAVNGGLLGFVQSTNAPGGVINATAGSTVGFYSTWDNDGVVNATDATLNFEGTFDTADMGTLNRVGGSANIAGFMNNAGSTLALSSASPSWTLKAGRISGGTITASGGEKLTTTGGILQSLTLAADVEITPATTLTASGNLILQNGARITINGSAAPTAATTLAISPSGGAILGGTGEVVFRNGNGMIQALASGLTLQTGVTIRNDGVDGAIAVAQTAQLTNEGMIAAQGAGRSIVISGSPISNQGRLEATGGASLLYTPGSTSHTLSNRSSGVILAGTDSTFTSNAPIVAFGGSSLGGEGTVVAANGLTIVASANRVAKPGSGALDVRGTASLVVQPNARLNLTGGAVIVRNGAVGTWDGTAYTALSGHIDAGRGPTGTWSGMGIVTTDTRAVNNNDLISIGIATVADVRGIAPTATTTFAGLTVNGSDALMLLTYGGDANLDGKINIDDYGRIDGNVSQSGSVFGWFNGDFNYDGKINIDDYGIIDGNINRQGQPFSISPAAPTALEEATALPEPAAAPPLFAVGAVCLRRQRCPRLRNTSRGILKMDPW